MTDDFAIAVVGAGPIGAAAATHLRGGRAGSVALVHRAGPQPEDTYRSSGGSVCWRRPDPERAERIESTAKFLRAEVAAGAPVRLADRPYLFLDEGVPAPGLNVGAATLVDHLRARAASGTAAVDVGRVVAVSRTGTGGYLVEGTDGRLRARAVLLAMGTAVRELRPTDAPVEKRQLFVTDLPVGPERLALPHLVVRVGEGWAFAFVKELDEGHRILVGHEDVVPDDAPGPVDLLPQLLAAGLARRLPFLEGATTERVLHGVDWVAKDPVLDGDGAGLVSVTCGSAVRACAALGGMAAAAVTGLLAP